MVTSGEDANVSIMSKGPVAAFSGKPTSGPKPLTVTFTDSSKGSITSEVWEYKLHSGSTWMTLPLDGSASFSFTNAGIYDIQLTVTGKSGSNTKTEPGYISVNETAPLAAFSGSPQSGSKPLNVTFTDSSTGVIASYSWNFGDGGTSNIQNPSHTYTAVGTFTVNLTVTGPGGADVENKPDYITVTNATTRIGIYRDSVWNLDRYGNGGIGAGTDSYSAWNNALGDFPIAGDWNADGRAENGVYRPGAGFYLKMDNSGTWNPSTDRYLTWDNAANDRPIAGDWNADGRDETGVYRPGVGFYLKMDNSSTWNPSTDRYLTWDNAAYDRPIAGDWNNDTRTETGVYRPGAGFYLKMDNGSTWNPSTDLYLAWDNAAIDLPIAGDWNMDERTETGVYRPGAGFYLKMDNVSTWTPSSGVNTAYTFPGVAGWPVVGDWNGTGTTKIGIYKEGDLWYLDWNGNGVWDAGTKEFYNIPTGTFPKPVIGDWNGDGKTKVGSYRNGYWSLDYSGGGAPYSAYYSTFIFNGEYDYLSTPIVGDWNGKGKSKIGVYKYTTGDWYLDYDGDGEWNIGSDRGYNFGVTGWTPVVGDWNGDEKSKIGVFKDGAWRLDYYGNGSLIKEYSFGATGSIPVIGDWNGDGKAKIGVYKDGDWYLDYDGNGVWDATADKEYSFGATGWIPIVGKWSLKNQ